MWAIVVGCIIPLIVGANAYRTGLVVIDRLESCFRVM